MLHDQEPKERLARRGVPSLDERQGIALAQVSANLAVEVIILQEAVQLLEDGIGLVGQFWDTDEDVFVGIAIDEHRSTTRRGTRRIMADSHSHTPISAHPIFPLNRNSN
jgi:hypothetical protein